MPKFCFSGVKCLLPHFFVPLFIFGDFLPANVSKLESSPSSNTSSAITAPCSLGMFMPWLFPIPNTAFCKSFQFAFTFCLFLKLIYKIWTILEVLEVSFKSTEADVTPSAPATQNSAYLRHGRVLLAMELRAARKYWYAVVVSVAHQPSCHHTKFKQRCINMVASSVGKSITAIEKIAYIPVLSFCRMNVSCTHPMLLFPRSIEILQPLSSLRFQCAVSIGLNFFRIASAKKPLFELIFFLRQVPRSSTVYPLLGSDIQIFFDIRWI